MKLIILARGTYCARVLEYLMAVNMGHYMYTPVKEFGSLSLAVFIFEGTEEEMKEIELWVRGMFNTFDVITYRCSEN